MIDLPKQEEWQEREALKILEQEEEMREAIQESRGDGEDFE